tara:strand:+ start:139 stop:759 length:621 start_codon:yes stop_codon:yes gene_type:complete
MHKKKKKQKSSNLKKRKRIFIKFAIPGDKGKETLIEARHLQRGIDFLYQGHKPGSAAWRATTENITKMLRYNIINWHGIILFCEALRVSPASVYSLLAKHFSQEKVAKAKVGFLNAILVKSLLKKIDQWGGVPKAWKNHKAYINSWCRKTGTPLFNSLSNFQDLVTAWREATVGKRGWTSIAKEAGIDSSGDKEFSIFNTPKSLKK